MIKTCDWETSALGDFGYSVASLMRITIEEALVSKTKHKERKPPRKTRHHRRPRVFNGKGKENISIVTEQQHRAYHTLFAWAHPAIMVAQILNAKWLCHSEVLVPVPTSLLPKVLEYLTSIGHQVNEQSLGITESHRKRYETKSS